MLTTGWFVNSALFGAGEVNQTTLVSAGGSDVFLAKYKPDGTLVWARRAGGSFVGALSDLALGIAALSDGTAFVTGKFTDTATFGLGELNQTSLNSAGSYDVFISRFNK